MKKLIARVILEAQDKQEGFVLPWCYIEISFHCSFGAHNTEERKLRQLKTDIHPSPLLYIGKHHVEGLSYDKPLEQVQNIKSWDQVSMHNLR